VCDAGFAAAWFSFGDGVIALQGDRQQTPDIRSARAIPVIVSGGLRSTWPAVAPALMGRRL